MGGQATHAVYDDIDHDEHRAVAAEQEAERASEAAHEQQRLTLITELRALAERSTIKAGALHRTLGEQIMRQAMPSTVGSLFMLRAASVAHLAGRAATTVERDGGYDLRGQVEALLAAALRAEPTAVAEFAASRVRLVLAHVLGSRRAVHPVDAAVAEADVTL
jgi:hypothetical protein